MKMMPEKRRLTTLLDLRKDRKTEGKRIGRDGLRWDYQGLYYGRTIYRKHTELLSVRYLSTNESKFETLCTGQEVLPDHRHTIIWQSCGWLEYVDRESLLLLGAFENKNTKTTQGCTCMSHHSTSMSSFPLAARTRSQKDLLHIAWLFSSVLNMG